jgi:hypothetical protein
MTESPLPTTTLPIADRPGLADDDVYPTRETPARRGSDNSSPVADITPEKPRRHPIAYAALGLSILSLLWLAVLTSNQGDDGFQKVRVGSQDCVSVPQDSGPAALYCRTAGVPRP